MKGDLCPICRGSGNIVTFARGLEFWRCLCAGSGVTVQHGPTPIHRGKGRPA